jgi:uncharacterized protein DUF6977
MLASFKLQMATVNTAKYPLLTSDRPVVMSNGLIQQDAHIVKVFERGGPYVDLYWKTSREAKLDQRLRESGKLIGFKFEGETYPTSPSTVFYDWLYFKALYPHREWLKRRAEWAGFTDIEFNPERSISCQARSFAAFLSLQRRDQLDYAVSSFQNFKSVMQSASI